MRTRTPTLPIVVALAILPFAVGCASGASAGGWAVRLPASVRSGMNALFLENNRHWDELGEMNTLTQMLGTAGPTQREYLGCLRGAVSGDTVHVTELVPARGLKQLQFAADGDCAHVAGLVGTWHTHPFRAGPDRRAVKERALSELDLSTFTAESDRVLLVVWDVDSLDAAVRRSDGSVLHPAPILEPGRGTATR